MSRAARRHHESRLKARWRRRVGRWFWPDAFPGQEEYVERMAVRRAHHDKCPCWLCKRERYDRRTQERTWPED